jgi:hypothetical protein
MNAPWPFFSSHYPKITYIIFLVTTLLTCWLLNYSINWRNLKFYYRIMVEASQAKGFTTNCHSIYRGDCYEN